jgi:PKD repeat protein
VLVEPSVQQSTTDAQGLARIVVTAPPPPAVLPASTTTLTITASEVDGDAFSTNNGRAIQIQLIPPAGTLPANRLPIASFTVAPAVGNIMQTITFDASQSTDEGEPCRSACTYLWDFGDFTTDSGLQVTHSYERPATYTVVLTVIDPRGGVGFTNRSLAIAGPAAPTASFTISPATVVGGSGALVLFNGAASTVGVGAVIEEYEWDFGDGNTTTTTTPSVTYAYGAVTVSTPRSVSLTVTDSFGHAIAFPLPGTWPAAPHGAAVVCRTEARGYSRCR